MEQKTRRNVWLDIFRYFLAFLVVSIHTSTTIGGIDFSPLCRIAVPAFFMISGYFSYKQNHDDELESAKKAVKRNFIYMIITISLLVTLRVIRILIDGDNLVDYIYSVMNGDLFFNILFLNYFPAIGQGWFILALFLISLVQYFLVKYKHTNLLNFFIPIGLVLLMTPYIYQICGKGVLQLEYYRNWLILGYPCFSIGYVLNKYIKNNNKAWKGILELFFALTFIVTSFLEKKYLTEFEYYISSLLSAFCFVLFFDYIGKAKRGEKFAKFETNFSKWFYKWIGSKGPFFIFVFHIAVAIMAINELKLSGVSLIMFSFFITFLMYEIFFLLFKLIKRIRLNKIEKSKIKQ